MLALAPVAEGWLPRRAHRRPRHTQNVVTMVVCAHYQCGEQATGQCERCETRLCAEHLARHVERCGV